MAKHLYITKCISHRGETTVVYLPKELGIQAGDKLNISFWEAGDEMPENALYRLDFVAKNMNSQGAIGIYIPKVFVGLAVKGKLISMHLIAEDSKDGDA